jgi:hypothetical protein
VNAAQFNTEGVTTIVSGYPSNPMDDMETFLPFSVLSLGRAVELGDFFTIDPKSLLSG